VRSSNDHRRRYSKIDRQIQRPDVVDSFANVAKDSGRAADLADANPFALQSEVAMCEPAPLLTSDESEGVLPTVPLSARRSRRVAMRTS